MDKELVNSLCNIVTEVKKKQHGLVDNTEHELKSS